MESEKVLKGVFLTLACAIVASTLYMAFFGYKDWEGALFYASRQIEYPISKYYYTYCYLPNVHMDDDIDESLGGTVQSSGDMMDTESDLSSDDTDVVVFGEGDSHYSSGWK